MKYFDEVWIDAIPKVASTTIREALVPSLSPSTEVRRPRAEDRSAGSEACRSPGNGTRSARFVLVRDPLARAMSAFHEIRRTRLGHWDRSRGRKGLPSLTADRHTFVTDAQVLGAYFADIENGVLDFDAHTWPQTRCVATSRWPEATVVGRLSRAKAAWQVFREAAGLEETHVFPDVKHNEHDPHREHHHHDHRSGADKAATPRRSGGGHHRNATVAWDDRAWDVFCRHYRRDYHCLGFHAPSPCTDRWTTETPAA